jgi:hypothetical protein
MAGFSSLDNLVSNVSNSGKFWRADWNKAHATAGTVVAGSWSCFAAGAGNPGANTTLGGTTLIPITQYDFLTTGGGIQHGGNVSSGTGYKVILNASAYTAAAAAAVPCVMMLVDLLTVIPLSNATIGSTGTKTILGNEASVSMAIATNLLTTTTDLPTFTPVSFSGGTVPTGVLNDGTVYWTVRQSATTSLLATSLVNAQANSTIDMTGADSTPSVAMQWRTPRYTSGAGVQAFLLTSTAGSAGTTTFQNTYTNSAGTGSRTTPSSPALPTNNATAPIFGIPYSGTGSGKFGPFMPLQTGDAGIRNITNIILASSGVTAGVYNLCLCKPLLTLPITTLGVASERDLVNQLPSMPIVYDGANLQWLIYAGAAIPNSAAYYGHIDLGWS